MTKESKPRKLIAYADSDGREPFKEWLYKLRDGAGRRRILARLSRVDTGNLGVYKSLGSGLMEMKLDFGPGYRIYFGEDGQTVVVLLCGGDKGSQKKDIRKAQEYWKEYKDHAKI